MNKNRALGFALIILGAVFIATTNRGARASTTGMVAGVLFIIAGLIRSLRVR